MTHLVPGTFLPLAIPLAAHASQLDLVRCEQLAVDRRQDQAGAALAGHGSSLPRAPFPVVLARPNPVPRPPKGPGSPLDPRIVVERDTRTVKLGPAAQGRFQSPQNGLSIVGFVNDNRGWER